MGNWDDATIISVETTQVVDTNPKVWLNASLESINEKDFHGALEKIDNVKKYSNGDRDIIGMTYALEIICYYETNNKKNVYEIKKHLSEGLEDFLFRNPEYILRYRVFDSASWDGLWEKMIDIWIKKRNYSTVEKFASDIDERLFAKLADTDFAIDVVQDSNLECFIMLVDGGYDFSRCIKDKKNLSMIAASIQTDACYWILNFLLEKRVFSINWQNDSGETLLMCAINNDAEKNAQLILKYNPDVNLAEKHGAKRTALHIAAAKGFSEILEMMASSNVDLNKKNSDGWTALHYAAYQNKISSLETLLRFNASVHEKNNNGETALHFAVRDSSCVRALIEHGADVKAIDNNGDDPLVCAIRMVCVKINEICEIPTVISLLYKAGVDLNKRYESLGHNRTILHYIAAKNHWEVDAKSKWETILDCGVDVNLTDDAGYTPLMLSVDHSWIFSDELDLARALVKKGASTSVCAKDGQTVESIMRTRKIDPSKLHNTKASNWFTKLFD